MNTDPITTKDEVKFIEERDEVINQIWTNYTLISAYEASAKIVNGSIWNTEVYDLWYGGMRQKPTDELYTILFNTSEKLKEVRGKSTAEPQRPSCLLKF